MKVEVESELFQGKSEAEFGKYVLFYLFSFRSKGELDGKRLRRKV